jgi:dipeptidyl aminopeptidase/acylaminoacyl peptidase
MQANAAELLTPIKNKVSVMIAQGDADTAVPVANTRQWVDAMKQLKMNYEYVELPGEDHGTIIAKSMPSIFAFFAEHSK